MATPSPSPEPVSLGMAEKGAVVAADAVAIAILSGQVGDFPVVVKLVAIGVAAFATTLGYVIYKG